MAAYLLDANVLIALVVAEHEHHESAAVWLADAPIFATCPVVDGALVRFLLRIGETAETARAVLAGLAAHPRHDAWADDIPFVDVDLGGVRGHRQVTDVYLASLAAAHGARLATLDRALAQLRPDATVLVPT